MIKLLQYPAKSNIRVSSTGDIIIVRGYSYLSASTGFRDAARQLCQLTVSKATVIAIAPAAAKIHQLNVVL